MTAREHLIRADHLMYEAKAANKINDLGQRQRYCELAAIQYLYAGDTGAAEWCIKAVNDGWLVRGSGS